MMEGFLSERGLEEQLPVADLAAAWLEEGEETTEGAKGR